MSISLFKYITTHLDEQGVFTSPTLPDMPNESIKQLLGTNDAAVYTMSIPADMQAASKLLKDLQFYLEEPLQPNRQNLYQRLLGMTLAEYCDPFVASFNQDDFNDVAFDLARRFFYNAKDREPLKFAYLLFGLYGMQKIEENDPELWVDMLNVAHCEEFTFAFLFACRLSIYEPQNELWELFRCTKGWGKVFTIIDIKCHNEDERLELLMNGPDIEVEYPPLSIKLISECRLSEVLAMVVHDLQKSPELYDSAHAIFKSSVAIIGNYLITLLSFPEETLAEQFNTKAIALFPLTLKHLALNLLLMRQHSKPEYALDALNIGLSLKQMVETNNYAQMSANECQKLIAAADGVIYYKDWCEDIERGLFAEDKVDYTLCDLAYELDMDIWESLYAYWLEHPSEYALFPYLLPFEGGDRSKSVLDKVVQLLPQYQNDESALCTPLRYLRDCPGEYSQIVRAALVGFYDLPRGIACSLLDAWGAAYITPQLHDALVEARRLSHNPVVSGRLDALLQGEEFSLEQFLDESM